MSKNNKDKLITPKRVIAFALVLITLWLVVTYIYVNYAVEVAVG